MTSHLIVMLLFAACVSVVFATLQRDTTREQIRMAARLFGALAAGGLLAGWILFGIFG